MKRTVRHSILITMILLTSSFARAQETGGTARTKALHEGWPDTPVGLMASGWIDAFSTDEDAMQKFLIDNLAEDSLAKRSIEVRMTSYRKLYAQFGILMLSSVVESSAAELTAIILAEDTSSHRFVFKVEEQAPHKLLTVGIVQSGHG